MNHPGASEPRPLNAPGLEPFVDRGRTAYLRRPSANFPRVLYRAYMPS
jgi:hypothetical protein